MAEIKSPKTSFKFNVTRQPAELIPPAGSTPYEVKELSDLDNAPQLRFLVVTVLAYKNHYGNNINKHCLHGTVHPAKVFKEAIAKALVSYYPFAGRVRAATGGRLVVECNGEGVLFIEADANVTLDEFGGDQFIYDPICMTDLLHVVPGSDRILHTPLLLIQVTRLKCGGFIFALRLNHTMADATGVVQFFNAVAEFARGAESPSITPVWERNLLTAQPLLEINFDKNIEMHEIICRETVTRSLDMVSKYFYFGSTQIAAIRSSLPQSTRSFTRFDLVVAHLWRSRSIALYSDRNDVVQLKYPINIRSIVNPPLPKGYYGNAVKVLIAETTVGELFDKPLQYALELITSPKSKHNIKSSLLSNVNNLDNMFLISDTTKLGFDRLDFGWGQCASARHEGIYQGRNFVSFLAPFKHLNETGVLAPIHLPRPAMEKFVKIVTQFNTLSNL
ncbi:benzyl alcohol O-benzoyltransferase-like isoform X1 [Silene latifolia]|uniref:benzyl alcohol O-benzoyltransferase-like isoform X1 n=1 Tax=Silene latifolia TaxID=37657 RepID=UPI003D771C08